MTAPDPMLLKAMKVHHAGRLAEAGTMYERILRRRPHDPDVLNFFGMLLFQQGARQRGIELLQKSVRSAPGNPHAWLNLGNMLTGTDDAEGGAEAFARVTELAPDMWQGWFNRATSLRRLHRLPEAMECLKTSISLKPDHDEAYERLGLILYRAGRTDEMASLYADWVKYNPDNSTARHMYAAAAGHDVPDRASDEFVRNTFDGYADAFDDNLKELHYQAPQLLEQALERHAGPAAASAPVDVLDAGAGTGLCGSFLRPRARTLVGVDLSSAMLGRARQRNLYDELVVMELCAFMRERPAAFDVVVSADTLCYFGALEEALAGAHHCLRPGGLLGFTVERWETDAPDSRFHMAPHGRYLHAERYLRSALEVAGFEPLQLAPAVLRVELGDDVHGVVVMARRAA